MSISGKKLFLFGFIIILLVAIPVTIYFLQKQQETRSRAQKSTILNFSPESSQSAPIRKQVGDSIPLDIMVDPGTNLVSFVKLQIQYDTDKLATASSNAFAPNTIIFPTVLEGPVYTPGKIEITLSVGPDPTKAVQSISKAGTITFTAVANTPDGQPTMVTYGVTTQVLSIGSSDQASENVLSSTNPATIEIGGPSPSTSQVPIPSQSPTPTTETSATPSPTGSVADSPTPSPTSAPGESATPTFTPTPTGTGSASTNQAPVCNTLSVDRATTGPAPFAITFTSSGSDADGTISKVNFNFGDGAVSGDITTAGGIGTNSINVQTTHEYQNVGTFVATALLTDNSGDVSSTDSCQQTIIVQGETATAAPTQIGAATATPTPTMAPTGIFDSALGIGAIALFLIIGGGLMFFVL